MEISRRDFIKKVGLTTGMLTAPVPLSLFLTERAMADPRTVEFKGDEIECNFTYIYNDKISLVVDIIRHYERIIFRGFIVAEGEEYDFSRLTDLFPFPRPNVDPPFYCSKNGDMVNMDLRNNVIEGAFDTHPISFDIEFNIEGFCFNSLESGLGMDKLPSGMTKWFDPTRFLSLLQEDYPLITVRKGQVRFNGRSYDLTGARGAMAHHWGWEFPDYVFLMCNDFEKPDTLLSLSYARTMTTLGSKLVAGYVYISEGENKEKKFVSPINGSVQYFLEDGLLCIVARRPEGILSDKEIVRINVDYKKGKTFPNFFNSPCETVVDVPCEIEYVSERVGPVKGARAVLDVKGFALP